MVLTKKNPHNFFFHVGRHLGCIVRQQKEVIQIKTFQSRAQTVYTEKFYSIFKFYM